MIGRGWLWIGLLACILVATACGSAPKPEPEVRTVTVSVPVSRSCLPDTPLTPPAFVDTDEAIRAAPGGPDRYRLAIAGRLQNKGWIRELEAALRGCKGL